MRGLITCLILTGYTVAFSQVEAITIDSILLDGHKRTRTSSILRELPFQDGDTILVRDLDSILSDGEKWLMQTGLFNRVHLYLKNWEGHTNRVVIQVELEEAWSIYPIPLFELADRNFNVWWVDHQHTLSRTNYGIDFRHRNTTGRGDRSKAILKLGYTQLFQIQYALPYFNRAKNWGFTAHLLLARNKEVNYATIDNRQAFFRSEEAFAHTRFTSQFALIHRPKLDQHHRVQLSYFSNWIAAKISEELNPDYFLEGKQTQRYFSLTYAYVFDNRDARPYPTAGQFFSVMLEKDGLGIFGDRNGLTLFGDYRRYWDLGSSFWNMAISIKGKHEVLRHPQPYNDSRAIGFQERNLHGYEYYIIDGPDMLLVNSSLRIKLWQDQINFGKLVPFEPLRRMPFKFFASLNSDWGYVHNPWNTFNNSFNNRLLWGGGLGLDMVFFFDFVLRVEGSVNHLKEPGLFIHFNTGL